MREICCIARALPLRGQEEPSRVGAARRMGAFLKCSLLSGIHIAIPNGGPAMARERIVRLHVELQPDVLAAIRDFQFNGRFPSRAAAVREILKRGLRDWEKDQPSQSS